MNGTKADETTAAVDRVELDLFAVCGEFRLRLEAFFIYSLHLLVLFIAILFYTFSLLTSHCCLEENFLETFNLCATHRTLVPPQLVDANLTNTEMTARQTDRIDFVGDADLA